MGPYTKICINQFFSLSYSIPLPSDEPLPYYYGPTKRIAMPSKITRLLHTAGVYAVPAGAALLLYFPSVARQADTTVTAAVIPASNTTAGNTANNAGYPDSIVTFEQLDMPIEMEFELSRVPPKGVLLYHSEFQGMRNSLYGQTIRTIKIWYIDDHLIGYVIERPFDGVKTIKKKINIPVIWSCTPAIEGHGEHQVATLAALRVTEGTNKCTGWHLVLPPPIQFQQPVKLQKAKKGKRGEATDSTVAAFGNAPKTSSRKLKKQSKQLQNPIPPSAESPAADSTGTKQP